MGGFKKRIIALTILFVFCFNTSGFVVSAKALSASEERGLYKAGYDISDAMRFIMEYYAGDAVTIDQLYDAAMHGMMDALDDYSEYFTKEEFAEFMEYFVSETYGLGIMSNYKYDGSLYVSRVYEGSPAEKAGIKKGDTIVQINGNKVKGKYWEEIDYYYSLNKTGARINISRNGEEKELYIEFAKFSVPTVFVSTLNAKTGRTDLPGGIRVVELTSVSDGTAKELKTAIDKMQEEGVTKVILDLRGNSGGYLDVAVDICNLIVPKGVVLTTVDNDGNKITYTSKLEKVPFEKMIVLTDGYTASAGEVIAGALQDSKAAAIIGETTYGKGVVQTTIPIEDGAAIKLTTERYFRRSGAAVNKVGIIPNIKVELLQVIFDDIDVKPGEKSEELLAVKKALALLGYKTASSDSVLDKTTIDSIKEFQAAHDIKATGELDYNTMLNLNIDLYLYYLENDVVLDRAIVEIVK